MEIRGGDRLTDEQGDWEVDTHPAALHGGKSLHARLRKVGEPGIVRYVTWPIHERAPTSEDSQGGRGRRRARVPPLFSRGFPLF
jgi:hypothetical protein